MDPWERPEYRALFDKFLAERPDWKRVPGWDRLASLDRVVWLAAMTSTPSEYLDNRAPKLTKAHEAVAELHSPG